MNKYWKPQDMEDWYCWARGNGHDAKNHMSEILEDVENMQARIKELEAALENVYSVGLSGIGYVGAANYAERESKARRDLQNAYDKAKKVTK